MDNEIKNLNIKNLIYDVEFKLCKNLILYFISQIKDNNNFLVKDKNNRKVYKFYYNKQTYYVKYYYKNSIIEKYKTIFRKNKAIKAFEKIKSLKMDNISVVEPVLAFENKDNTSILITKEFGKNNLLNTLSNQNLDFNLKRKLIDEYAKIISALYSNNYLHKDPNLESISVILKNSSIIKIGFVDIDEIKKMNYLPKFLIKKNLVKINSHSYAGLYYRKYSKVNFKDRIYFLKKLLKYYKGNFNFRDLFSYIKDRTIKVLEKWNKDKILKDEF